MDKPKSKPLSDNPRSKQVKSYRLESEIIFDEIPQSKNFLNENNQQNNSESIQQLESESSD